MRYILRAFGICLVLMTVVMAQLALDLEIRPRLEYQDGYKGLVEEDSAPAILVSQRSRLRFQYSGDRVGARFSLQDVRIWGDETNVSSTGVTGDPASIDLYEAWFESQIKPNLNIRIGRQAFALDDQRLISQRNWNQNGLCYDALAFQYTAADWQLNAALSLNNRADNSSANPYPDDRLKTLNFIHIAAPLSKTIDNSVLMIASGVTANDTTELIYMRGTIGDYCQISGDKLNLRAALYYQFGKNKSGQSVSAYLGSLDGQLTLNSVQAGAGVVYISGQDALKTGQDYQTSDHLFDILYGGRHGNYGLMDYFSNIPKSTAGAGLVDATLTFAGRMKNISIQIDAHRFHLAHRVLMDAQDDPLDPYLGTEFDLRLTGKINPVLSVQGGYSWMLPGESLELLQGINPGDSGFPQWGWLMVTFNPSMLKGNQ